MPRKKVEVVDNIEDTSSEKSINTKKLMKDIEKQLTLKQEEIISNITAKIDEQIEVRVNKRMKEEEKKILRGKNMKILRRDIVIIILILLVGYFGYCLFDVDYFNIRTKVVEVPVEKQKESNVDKKEELDSGYYIDNYRYLVDNMQIDDKDIFDLYSNTNTTNSSISNKLKLKIAYKNLDSSKKEISDETITFKADDLLETAKKIFGENVVIENEIFSYNNTKFMFYNDTYLGFVAEEDKIDLVYEIYDARENNNNLEFDIVVGSSKDKKPLSKNKDLSKYEYSFSKSNDSYVFESIKSI